MTRARLHLTLALALVLAGCPSNEPPKPPPARGTMFQDAAPKDPYAGPPKTAVAAETRASGLKVHELRAGQGAAAEAGKTVFVEYRGWLSDGSVFDSSRSSGPFSFELGQGKVIKGWDEGVVGMKVGGLRRLVVTPELGYGNQRAGKIPGGSTLTFDIELLDVR